MASSRPPGLARPDARPCSYPVIAATLVMVQPESTERACTAEAAAGVVSVCTVARGAPGAADTLVQERAWFQAARAEVAASPESG